MKFQDGKTKYKIDKSEDYKIHLFHGPRSCREPHTSISHTKQSAQTFFYAAQTSVGVYSGLGREICPNFIISHTIKSLGRVIQYSLKTAKTKKGMFGQLIVDVPKSKEACLGRFHVVFYTLRVKAYL